ncbi:hypothetical protein PFISCL1PPCAC_17952, partial [Pristionchus fissidentatus]
MAARGFDPVRNHHEKMAYVNHCLRVLNARSTMKPKDPPKPPAPRPRSSSFHARERKRLVDAENDRLLKKLTDIEKRPNQHPPTPSRSLSRSSSTRNTTSRFQSISRLSSSIDRSSRSSSVSKLSKTSKTPSTPSSSAHVRDFDFDFLKHLMFSTDTSSSEESHTSTNSDSSDVTMSRDSLEGKE